MSRRRQRPEGCIMVCIKKLESGGLSPYYFTEYSTAEEARDSLAARLRWDTTWLHDRHYALTVGRLTNGRWVEVENIEGPLTAAEISAIQEEDARWRAEHPMW